MPNIRYISGRNFEYSVMKTLKPKKGFVLRTAGSHGKYDIISVDLTNRKARFVQCKYKKSIKKCGSGVKFDISSPILFVATFEKWVRYHK